MITSDRRVFVGAHVTEAVKDALREEAKKRQVSMSLLVSLSIIEGLERRGHKLENEPACGTAEDVGG
jgi:hypothetical protein